MSDVKAVTDATFQDEVIGSDVPVMVDFWAPWCGPCNILTPVVDEIAREMAGKVKVVKVNVDESQGVASQYSIMSIPTLMFFKGGQRVGQIVGAQPKKVIVDNLTKLL